ncbi:receptor like protein kinase [Arabidopsis thaliana]|jgi:serine/threonine protein kinase|uniref:Lectin-domain containing receptor kinase VI.3 n=2 Tax=Arabidopsis thaliana TaxID=3702 RepID=LRK63_ARATH|nr:RecName: Full=Lectin-domain containing receptor kinase VI.3; Short=LecRK-VI.3; AltName: Full=Lectin receptor kinase A4.2; Flags: Precursor [Arabidopsis thaliana]CAB82271.1 receptor like protein kinase [Arabidopsis thaliana]
MLVLFLLLTIPTRAQRTTTETPKTEFIFRGFSGNQSNIVTTGAATIKLDGLLRLTDRNSNVTGTSFYHKPVRLLETNTSSTNSTIRSFSTSFVFVIIPTSSSNGGFGFTFTLSPTPDRTGAESAQYLGLLNKANDGNSTNHVFAVEFDTVQGFKDGADRTGNHIGLNFNSLTSDVQEPVVYYDNEDPNRKEDFPLQSGDPIRAILDYDGPTQTLNLTVYPANLKSRPVRPLISRPVPKLSQIVQEEMYVGFTAATGRDQSSAHYVMGWSFSSGGDLLTEDTLDLLELPRPPPNTAKKRGYNSQVLALIVALSGVTVILLALLFFFVMYKKRLQQGEVLEDWEINHPHRLRYKDLYAATDGFKENRIVGTGGFGTVFRGNLSSPSSDQIAVKKITPNSMQGVREFIAEIESLGRLRHKNLVNLQGWCKQKNDLLLIYDYIPNGSLDSLLYSRPRQSGVVLSWNARFKIAKGIASGLLYLHEEWEKVVIHRDIKPSNVLIEDDMNPRLGDFGLARLYERGSQSNTTVVVGTIGYMAPELARNGKSSSASDVFAFGVLLLEIVSGRRPTDSGTFFLADWVMELHARGEILHAVDPRLGFGYDGVEARLALVVGLLCCHQRPTSRPSMRTVLRYLNGDDDVPEIDNDWGYSDSSRSDLGSNFEGYVSSDRASSSVPSFSVTRVSSSSVISGR